MGLQSIFRVSAIVSSLALAGGYVWFRSARAEQPRAMPGSKSLVLTAPTSQLTVVGQPVPQRMLIHSSKSGQIVSPLDAVTAPSASLTLTPPASQPTTVPAGLFDLDP